MAHLIDKSALVAEIEKYISNYRGILNKVDKSSDDWVTSTSMIESKIDVLQHVLSFLNTLEVKDANEALRTEYEKGRADVIQATEQWLANSWPKYCENPNIIKAFKENVIED